MYFVCMSTIPIVLNVILALTCIPHNSDLLLFRAEAAELLLVARNLISPRNGEPLIAATQDFLTGSYMLTQKDVYFDKSQFCRLIAYLTDANELIHMPPPAIYKPRILWTGKQVITMLVKPNTVNLESEEKFYNKRDKHMCDQDG